MARFTIRELDDMAIHEVLTLSRIEGLTINLIAGVEQREHLVEAYSQWAATLDPESRASAHWDSQQLSNFALYSELRTNSVNFERVADGSSFTLDELDGMSDEAVMAIANHGGVDLVVDDLTRDEMLRTHAGWLETLDMDIRDAYVGDQSTRSNWELYSEIRINGAVPHHAPSKSMSMAQSMSPGL